MPSDLDKGARRKTKETANKGGSERRRGKVEQRTREAKRGSECRWRWRLNGGGNVVEAAQKKGGGPRVPDRTFADHDLPPTRGRVGCATPEGERKVEQRWGKDRRRLGLGKKEEERRGGFLGLRELLV
jgi:hypothetical protein